MNTSLLHLLQLSDPTLPIGGYSHSAGLETYVQNGIVNDRVTAKIFITEMLSFNFQYTDAAFASLAFQATSENKFDKLIELDQTCTAVKLPSEIRSASQKLGIRLMKIFQPNIPTELSDRFYNSVLSGKTNGNYCITFGMYAHILGINKEEMLTGFFYNAAVGFVTNSVKLIPLGQQDGQDILFSLHTLIKKLAHSSLEPDEDLIGLCCTGFDIRSMQHEKLYSRLYMS